MFKATWSDTCNIYCIKGLSENLKKLLLRIDI